MNSVFPTLSKLVLFSAFLLGGCASSRRSELPPDSASMVKVKKVNSFSEMNISFKTDRGTITYEVNPNDEDIFITMKGGNSTIDTGAADIDFTEKQPEKLESGSSMGNGTTSKAEDKDTITEADDKTEEVLALIRKAQELFYEKEYAQALKTVEQAIGLKPTAEGYALKGSVYYMLGENSRAEKAWESALGLNPDMPGVKDMIKKVKGGK